MYQIDNPKVFFTIDCYKKIMAYINSTDLEISGLGSIRIDGQNIFVTDVFLLMQRNNSVETNFVPEDVDSFITDLIKKGASTGNIKVWWHSHNIMDTFWSHDDSSTIDHLKNSWMISIVGNKQNKFECRLDFYKPFRLSIPLQWQIFIPDTDIVCEDIRQEVAQKVIQIPEPKIQKGRYFYPNSEIFDKDKKREEKK